MAEKEKIDFCTICRKETEYVLKKRNIKKNIKDVEYMFNNTIAIFRKLINSIETMKILFRLMILKIL